jgi:striatin 1/3/4
LWWFQADNNTQDKQINRVVTHPTLPLTVTAHEDRHIRFFDNTSGKMVHSMVAHLDAVTSLAIDPNGLYLLSGSELDCHATLFIKCCNPLLSLQAMTAV